MILRPRQQTFVERSVAALDEHGNTLGVAPTGAGKTIMLSATTGRMLTGRNTKACILAHRDELVAQNHAKFARVNPDITTSVFDAKDKSWDGQATFAMVQTLSRDNHLANMPALDLLVIDEAHHAASVSYRRVIDRVLQKNANAKIYGVTATPMRGDGKGLRDVFTNVADQIRLGELIASGHLVPPRTFVVDVGTADALSRVKKTASDFDMAEVESIMNKTPVNDAVIRHWQEKASGRKTIVFGSTIAHASSVSQAFNDAGIAAVLVHGELSEAERKSRLSAFEQGDAQVVVNVAVLTEGYDYTPTSCIVLLRPSSHKSTLMQMVGRGLRTVDPAEHPGIIKSDCIVLDFGTATLMHGHLEQDANPGIIKSDCIVLDFGTATLMHGHLEQDANLDGRQHSGGEAPSKECPGCQATVPAAILECPLCGFEWTRSEGESDNVLTDFVMTEVDLLARSSFRWCDLFSDDCALVATGFNAWGGVFYLNGRWHALGGGKQTPPRLLGIGERSVCLAQADDWLNTHETADSAHKSKRWLNEPPTLAQLKYLPAQHRNDYSLTRYQASALLAFHFSKPQIQKLVFAAEQKQEAA